MSFFENTRKPVGLGGKIKDDKWVEKIGGMITCSTIPGKAVCKMVWNMGKDENTPSCQIRPPFRFGGWRLLSR